jgi:hypothetical protein
MNFETFQTPRRTPDTIRSRAPDYDPFAVIQGRLRPFPHARYEASENSIEVYPVAIGGFRVVFRELEDSFQVACDGWYAHFEFADEAVACFLQALSPAARLRVVFRGQTPCRWQLEVRGAEHWRSLAERARLFTPFWRRASVEYLQNHLLEAA